MTPLETRLAEASALIERYRATCLWWAPSDFPPPSVEGTVRALLAVEQHADLEGYRAARELREWLSRNSSGASAA